MRTVKAAPMNKMREESSDLIERSSNPNVYQRLIRIVIKKEGIRILRSRSSKEVRNIYMRNDGDNDSDIFCY